MVVVGGDVAANFDQIRSGALRYIILRIREDEIFVSERGPREASYEDFLSSLKSKGCSFGVIEFQLNKTSSNLLLISWTPDSESLQNKIFYSSSYFILQNTINIENTIQASEDSEVCVEAVRAEFSEA